MRSFLLGLIGITYVEQFVSKIAQCDPGALIFVVNLTEDTEKSSNEQFLNMTSQGDFQIISATLTEDWEMCLQNKKGPRIRQGSPQEEEALVSHILSLAPSLQTCTEVGQLTEVLVLFGHEGDGRKLQALLSEVIVQQKAAAGRASTSAFQPAKESAPKQIPATAEAVDWKWDILRPVQQ